MLQSKEIKSKPSRLIICAVTIASTLFLLYVDYFYSNNPYPFFDSLNEYSIAEYIRRNQKTDNFKNDALYINIAYDKSLITISDSIWGLPIGNIDITDRRKLATFINILRLHPNYKYIFMDVRLEKGYEDNTLFIDPIDNKTKSTDSVLTNVIKHTKRFIFANHLDMNLLDSSLYKKCAINDYKSTIISTNFVRYEYLHDNQLSIPLKLYKDLYNGEIVYKYGAYFDRGKLCYNSPFFQISSPFPGEYDIDGNKNWLNLGCDILDDKLLDITSLTKNKIVIIGDFIEDCHDTYIGPQPGSYITYCAFETLRQGKHLVSVFGVIILAIVYSLLSLFSFSNKSVILHIKWIQKIDSKFLRIFLSFLGISFVLECTSISLYLMEGITTPISIATTYFTILKTILDSRQL